MVRQEELLQEYGEVLLLLGRLLFARGDHAEAVGAYRKAIPYGGLLEKVTGSRALPGRLWVNADKRSDAMRRWLSCSTSSWARPRSPRRSCFTNACTPAKKLKANS